MTNENKHTPGPWYYDWTTKINGVIQGWSIGPADKPLDEVDHIDPVLTISNDADNAEANARLIAAAPELLEALIEMTCLMEQSNGVAHVKGGTLDKARQAIANARGQ